MIRGTLPKTVTLPWGLIRLTVSPTPAPSASASRAPIATVLAPGTRFLSEPDLTLSMIGLVAAISGSVMPRTSTPSTRLPKLAISGCSISGVALVTPGNRRTCAASGCHASSLPP